MRAGFTGALLLLVLAAAACDEPGRETGGREILIVGVAGGAEQGVTKNVQTGVDMAVGEYNSHPDSTYQVRRQTFDTGGTAEGSAAAGQAILSTERLIGVIGPHSVEEVMAIGGGMSQNSIPMLIPTVSDVRLGQQGWRSFRRLVASDFGEGEALGLEATARGDRAKVALFHDGGPGTAAVLEGAKSALDGQQVPIARFEEFGGESPDFAGLAGSMATDQPAVVIYAGPAARAGVFFAALRAGGFQGPFLASHDARGEGFREAAGEAAEGTITACVCADPGDRQLEAFAQRYRGRFGAGLPVFAVEAYEGAFMVLEAIQEVEARPRAITDFFGVATDFLGESKVYRYAENGELRAPPVWLYQARGDNWQAIGRSRTPEDEAGSVR